MLGGNFSFFGFFFVYLSIGVFIIKLIGNVVYNFVGVCNQNVIYDLIFGLENVYFNGNIYLRVGDSGYFNWQNFNFYIVFLSNGINGVINVFNLILEVVDYRLVRLQSFSIL